MEFDSTIIVVSIFFTIVGWYLRQYWAIRSLHKLIHKMDEIEQTEEDADRIVIDIEQHENMLFVYDRETGQFMAQGKNGEELKERLSQRYPGGRFLASEEDLMKAGLLE